jgi:hypothetical protein
MSDTVIVAFVVTSGTIINALIGGFILRQSQKNGSKAAETHDLINSRMTELLKAATESAHAQGVEAGAQAQRDRSAPADGS